jgi:hypothetical protein
MIKEMPSTRCQCYTKQNLVCKKNFAFIIQNKRYCHIHAKQIYNENIIKIQSLYRSYKCRQKINILFKPLPKEVQDIVLYYFRQSYYIEKFNISINKILSNRVDKYIGDLDHLNIAISREDNINQRQVKFYTDIIEIYNLYTKYCSICNYQYCYRLHRLVRGIWNIYRYQIEREELLLDDDNNNIVIDNNSKKLSKTLYDSLTIYNTTFSYNFNQYNCFTPIKIYYRY